MRLTNDSSTVAELLIEPWGDIITLAPHADVEILVSGKRPGTIHLARDDRGMVVYAWPGASLMVRDVKTNELLWMSSQPSP